MKKINSGCLLVLSLLAIWSCKKSNNPAPPATTAKCKPLTFSSNYGGNAVSYVFTYSADGNMSGLKYYLQNALRSSELVVYNGTSTTSPATVNTGLTDSFNVYYDADIFNHLPTSARVWITLDGITQVDYKYYSYLYDSKDRLIKVKESTPHITGDAEYDLQITYNDKDNVTALNFVTTTGQAGTTTILATNYDDKPNQFAGVKNWPFMMPTDWTSSDPGPIFTALSKNNLLGYTFSAIGFTRTSVFTYNGDGFPTKIVSTNKNASGTASFEENYTYACQ